ncbi:neurotrophin receptor-interacting factor 2-like [Protopterus annectens]|uniref:neurotrophin receptor-interacting factor 2-like n=1 Tax=Protopterus annectens TaxID=7888 RepID=UPI001CFC4618|nr:neurotrophin receptor-interacting factor 2-like [Protopterus annectens]
MNQTLTSRQFFSVLAEDIFNLEKYIKHQFTELHQFLLDKEQQLIQQLKNNKVNTLKWMEGNLNCIKQEIVTYLVTDSNGNLEDKIKEEDSLKIMEENVTSVENDAVAIKNISHSNMEIRRPEPVGLLTEDIFNLEKYIKHQFTELHQFLLDKEQQLIQQLKNNKVNTLKWMEGNLNCIKQEIVTYLVTDSNGNLEDKIKEEDSLKIMEENVTSVENDAVAIKNISHSNMEIRRPEPVGLLTEDVFNLEKYIKQQFAELHQFLLDKEQQLILQLKNDEANTLKWMEGSLECIKQEIVTYLVTDSDGNLEDKIKEEDSLKIMEENVKSVENDAVAINSISDSNWEIIQPEPVGLLTVPETFEDVTVTFTEEEWKLLRKQDKELYRDVMVQNYETCVSVGYKIPPEKLLQLFKADEVPKDIVTGINIRKQKDNFEENFNSM